MRPPRATALRLRAASAYLFIIALFLVGASTTRAADVETLQAVHVGKRALVFDVTNVGQMTIVAAKVRLRARWNRIDRLLARRYDGRPAARHRARKRIRRSLHRSLQVFRVQEAASTGKSLRVSKPTWTRGGLLNVETKASTASSSSTGGPPSGLIVKADYMTRACPIDGLWGAVSDAHYYAQSCAGWSDPGDPQINLFASGGSPVPGQDGLVHPGFRRLSLTNGKQSIYDRDLALGGAGNHSYRTQLIANSDIRTYYPMVPGHRYVWWLSVRFQNPTPLQGYPDNQDGDTQIWQIKNQGSTCEATTASGTQPGPIEMMYETANTIRLTVRNRNGTTADGAKRIDQFPIGERGVWQTFALDVYYSSDPTKAAYRLWADQDGNSSLALVPLTPKITGWRTAIGPECIGYPSIGPYQPMDLPAVSRDYGTNEMTEVPVGASWG